MASAEEPIGRTTCFYTDWTFVHTSHGAKRSSQNTLSVLNSLLERALCILSFMPVVKMVS